MNVTDGEMDGWTDRHRMIVEAVLLHNITEPKLL